MKFSRLAPLFLGFTLFLLATASRTTAQSVTPEFKIGLAAATLRGSTSAELKTRTGFAGGVGFRYGLRHGLSVMPEVLYVVKGSQADFSLTSAGLLIPIREGGPGDVPIHTVFEFTYVEVPVLLVYRLETRGRIHPKIFAGPSVSFLLDAKVRFRALSGGPEQEETDSTVRDRDYGAVLGGGLEFDMGGQRLSLGVRVTYGFSNTRKNEDAAALKNTSFVILTGLVF